MKISNILEYFSRKDKFSIINVHTGHEVWHMFVSRLNMIMAGLAFLIIFFVIVLSLAAYTPVLELVPGNSAAKSRKLMMDNIMRLDSLEFQLNRWAAYRNNITMIMEGGEPGSLTAAAPDTTKLSKEMIDRIPEDSILRMQMEQDGAYRLITQSDAKRKVSETTFELYPPVVGIITRIFNPKDGMYGVDIAPAPNQAVTAVLDGTVIFSTWSPKTGYTIQLQHAGNMVSIYMNCASLIKKQGERVKAGESLGFAGRLAENKISNITFELWYNGTPVDPQNYIVF